MITSQRMNAINSVKEVIANDYENGMPILKSDFWEIRLPRALNLEETLMKHPLKLSRNRFKNRPDKKLDRIRVILGQYHYLYFKKLANPDPNGWVHLCSQVLKDLDQDYNRIIHYLVDHRILDVNGSYSNDPFYPKCKSYRFHHRFGLSVGDIEWETYRISGKSLVKKLTKLRKPERTMRKYGILHDDLLNLDFDLSVAEGILKNKYGSLNDERSQLCLRTIIQLNQKSVGLFRICDVGRLYTPVTTLPKELREMMTWKGKNLLSYDLKNAVPLFSATLFDGLLLEDSNVQGLLSNALIGNNTPSLHPLTNADGSPRIMFLHLNNGVIDYIELVHNGGIYEECVFIWKDIIPNIDRKIAKKTLLSLLMSPKNYYSTVRQKFRDRFPGVLKTFEWVNKGFFKTSNGKGRYKKRQNDPSCPMAVFCFGMESNFILDTVCLQLKEEYPEMPLITIHDEVMTSEEYFDILKSKIEEEERKLKWNLAKLVQNSRAA